MTSKSATTSFSVGETVIVYRSDGAHEPERMEMTHVEGFDNSGCIYTANSNIFDPDGRRLLGAGDRWDFLHSPSGPWPSPLARPRG